MHTTFDFDGEVSVLWTVRFAQSDRLERLVAASRQLVLCVRVVGAVPRPFQLLLARTQKKTTLPRLLLATIHNTTPYHGCSLLQYTKQRRIMATSSYNTQNNVIQRLLLTTTHTTSLYYGYL